MIYNFDTNDRVHATAALLVYAVYRSRDKKKFKVSPEMWGQIQRFVQASAKRAKNIPQFINNLQPKMSCPTIHPSWVEVAVTGKRLLQSGDDYIQLNQPNKRQFLTEVLADINHKDVIKTLKGETQWVIMLVRDRLEAERPIEASLDIIDEEAL